MVRWTIIPDVHERFLNQHEKAMSDSEMDEKSIANLFKKFVRAYPKWIEMIAQSFLPEEQQELYRGQIERMSAKLGIVNT